MMEGDPRLHADRRGFLQAGGLTMALAAGGVAAASAPEPALKPSEFAENPTAVSSSFSLVNLIELEERARAIIPKGAFDYIARGAADEWTLAENRAAFSRYQIVPRNYAGAGGRDLSLELLGSKLTTPVIVAPMGVQAIASRLGEPATAAGAAAAGALFAYSTMSTATIEEFAATHQGPRWFQLYQSDDDGVTRELLQRARAAGFTAVIHTLDTIAPGNRDANVRNRYAWSASEAPGNFRAQGGRFKPRTDLGWKDLEFVQKESGLPVIPKGMLAIEDATRAVSAGAAGLWLSNHGGRALDGSPAPLTVLPAIADKVAKRVPIIIDGGVRRGQDVYRALARGASAVAVGRPIVYALGLGGATAVEATIRQLTTELSSVMRHTGAATLADIRSGSLVRTTG